MTQSEYKPRRSCLYMPGGNARALEKAKTLSADMLIIDLEDAVAPDTKNEARETVTAVVRDRPFEPREVLIRINAMDTAWGEHDIKAVVEAAPDGILVPKVTAVQDVNRVDSMLDGLAAPADLGIWVMIEMPLAVLNIQQIAAASQSTRLRGFVLGTNDLAKEVGIKPTADRHGFQVPLGLTLLAAKAYGLAVIDGVYNDIKDEAGLSAECLHGRNLGFDGKTLIHPSQIDTCNRVFSPDAQAIAHAQRVIEAFDDPANSGKGVIKVDGKMVELLHLEEARRLLSISQAIGLSPP